MAAVFLQNVLILAWLFPLLAEYAFAQPTDTPRPVRIACVGNSITFGGGLSDKSKDPYPAVLQQLLGEKFLVGNFGKNGATLLKAPENAYVRSEAFRKALAFKPDIVIIDLGINDTGLKVWPFHRDEFIADYLELIRTFRTEGNSPEIWLCTMTPYFNRSVRFKAALRDWYREVQENIRLVAQTAGTPLIDLQGPLYNKPHLFSDGVHPDKEGAGIIAQTIYQSLAGNYGGLSVAPVLGSHMVLQRNKPIPVWGKANRDDEITVSLAGEVRKTRADPHGKWKVVFPSRQAGGPFRMQVRTSAQSVDFEDIMVGEVWICSGQSNMAFKLSEASTAQADIPLANHPDIRLFSMKTVDRSIQNAWDSLTLARMNNLEYDGHSWTACTPASAAGFSAVAYYFGKRLHEQLKVPVGLIHNAKGGSPIEAWIDRHTLESDDLLADLLQDWTKNPLIAPWCRERAVINTANAGNPLQRHPYEPTYLFESCMMPWVEFPLKGAIWYQGEANTHNTELHESLFAALLKSWRGYWGHDFPVYYTQLSSFSNKAWPYFRNSQRRLMDVHPHTGMAVTTDLGDSTDIHPRRKKEVGERLALWALAAQYGQKTEYSGPVFDKAVIRKDKDIHVLFTHTSGLRTSDGKPVRTFEVAGEEKVFYPAEAAVKHGGILIRQHAVPEPRYIRYGWQPYSDGNLVNDSGLPLSTFSEKIHPNDRYK